MNLLHSLARLDETDRSSLSSGVDWALTTLRDRALDDQISSIVADGERVLDLGCGKGDLLARLKKEHRIHESGIEIEGAAVSEAIARGLSVTHGDLEDSLTSMGKQSWDLIILNQVITVIRDPVSILRESLRAGVKVAVTFPNFAGLRTRSQLALRGRLPVTPALPYQWYDTPNIRLVTVKDFRTLCAQMEVKILKEAFVGRTKDGGFRPVSTWPNLRATSALFLLKSDG
ncbi:MAG: methionine biosynthesis protein MetW [bacterium]|nr:methionine biosynthesis protein MetW [bacterium]MDT8367073.1 methionine biosynthesis protein MetW [bacterium]